MKVELTESEIYMAAQIGFRRCFDSLVKNHNPVAKQKASERWNNSIEGACAEMAFAKLYKIYWGNDLYNNFNGADFGKDIQIRHTRWPNGKLLIKTEREHPDHRYVLVRGIAPVFEIVGWIKGEDGMKKEYLDNPNGDRVDSYFIEAKYLNPIETLEVPYE